MRLVRAQRHSVRVPLLGAVDHAPHLLQHLPSGLQLRLRHLGRFVGLRKGDHGLGAAGVVGRAVGAHPALQAAHRGVHLQLLPVARSFLVCEVFAGQGAGALLVFDLQVRLLAALLALQEKVEAMAKLLDLSLMERLDVLIHRGVANRDVRHPRGAVEELALGLLGSDGGVQQSLAGQLLVQRDDLLPAAGVVLLRPGGHCALHRDGVLEVRELLLLASEKELIEPAKLRLGHVKVALHGGLQGVVDDIVHIAQHVLHRAVVARVGGVRVGNGHQYRLDLREVPAREAGVEVR
mmetsp:Transcript_7562/g.18134  ORF Transcript_7562/g.18134 Transcript_7562/m.18134 type:complete len:293 (-) Transcript_7562:127-1005(-)